MAAPIPAGVTVDQGRDWSMAVQWVQPSGTPVDNTSYTSEFAMRQDYGKPVISTLTSASGAIVQSGATGWFTVNLGHARPLG